ncbi:NADH-quinone oxidoreductase chain 3 [Tepidimonas alkaliphilus]|uniref:NADH-quinone oxidoreductase n=1 Tax=Tepidimonas alkaliphilus TaxID=2588942 RepID=A0A554WD12_9BURK|nr:NADH-quinone oxidoreductase subunit NuoG [Tepidimonas alkaliphilus]TSE21459.1 NADH-quinone oxidoreductase chain 3 [Tepidimonas alkaliphilus]
MVEIEIDGQKVAVPPGSMVMHAAEKAGVYIPHFCYHKKLSIAANCRMCLVDIEKAPKPMPACATPVAMGMVVRTKSDKAVKAQKAVMEFLLINHPLDCPICDQGGECQLQDLAVGYGGTRSRYEEEKRVVFHKNVGPLIAMEEMSRCIHCTRCVRFGQEIAGVMELGMSHRGEHSEIETFLGASVDSELSGNMIDLCPVGALTSKPFRYAARTWELARRRSISPHDSTGANLVVQVKGDRVLRVVPYENEAVNECWIADRDRFSYEALNSPDRLTQPMVKQGGQWNEVDWKTALEFVAQGLQGVRERHGAGALGLLASPHATVEELWLARALMAGLGSSNIDHRLRSHAFDHAAPAGRARWLGLPIAELSSLDRALVVGSNLRKDHPLFAQRIRQAVRKGAQVSALAAQRPDWAMPLHAVLQAPATHWAETLARVAVALAEALGVARPAGTEGVTADETARAIAASLRGGERKAVLLGNAAAHHERAASLLALAQWIAQHTGARWGYLTEAANTVGAQLVGALPGEGGLDAQRMLGGGLKAAVLLGVEPGADTAGDGAALREAELVVTLSPFKTNLELSDVLLPVAPFTETSGSFVNAEGRLQSFQAVVKPLGQTRPAWKVLRVLGNLLQLSGFDFESSAQVLAAALPGVADGGFVPAARLDNATTAPIDLTPAQRVPCVASIYQLDALVRRAPALQATADARAARVAAAEGVCA